MLKFDVIQVFINASATIGISVLWFEFSKKVFKTVCRLAAEPFYWPKKEDDSSSDCSDEEEGYWSDSCSEARPQIPEPPPFYIN